MDSSNRQAPVVGMWAASDFKAAVSDVDRFVTLLFCFGIGIVREPVRVFRSDAL